ncbi:MAG: hypothetical protein OK456_09865 [Thaumarchaeota archaeon]|nr:hypothetical protein [Nitrososphaerota archaeon]
MRAPRFAEYVSAVLACLAVATAAVGAYLGALALLMALTALLTSSVLLGRTDLRSWFHSPVRTSTNMAPGPVSRMAELVNDAAMGNRYARAEIAGLLSWMVTTKREGIDATKGNELSNARRDLLAILKEADPDAPLSDFRYLKGKSYIRELEMEVSSISDG